MFNYMFNSTNNINDNDKQWLISKFFVLLAQCVSHANYLHMRQALLLVSDVKLRAYKVDSK